MKVLGHRIKDYYSAIHTPLYSEEKNAFEILEEKFKCTRVYVYYFEERPECMSAIDGFDNNGDISFMWMYVIRINKQVVYICNSQTN